MSSCVYLQNKLQADNNIETTPGNNTALTPLSQTLDMSQYPKIMVRKLVKYLYTGLLQKYEGEEFILFKQMFREFGMKPHYTDEVDGKTSAKPEKEGHKTKSEDRTKTPKAADGKTDIKIKQEPPTDYKTEDHPVYDMDDSNDTNNDTTDDKVKDSIDTIESDNGIVNDLNNVYPTINDLVRDERDKTFEHQLLNDVNERYLNHMSNMLFPNADRYAMVSNDISAVKREIEDTINKHSDNEAKDDGIETKKIKQEISEGKGGEEWLLTDDTKDGGEWLPTKDAEEDEENEGKMKKKEKPRCVLKGGGQFREFLPFMLQGKISLII